MKGEIEYEGAHLWINFGGLFFLWLLGRLLGRLRL